MNVVGKVGSLITQGVYSVATPFHPFGGAVDVIVVRQQDGSFRSTPWYVRFGKFQGVLKGAEKIVRINVNGVEANFHMYLDNSGEAYFVREVNDDNKIESDRVFTDPNNSEADQPFGSEGGVTDDGRLVETCRLEHSVSDSGMVRLQVESDSSATAQASSDANKIERQDTRFFEFEDEQTFFEGSLELSGYGSNQYEKLDGEIEDLDSEVVLMSVDGHVLTAPISPTDHHTENVQLSTPQFHLGPGRGTEFCDDHGEFSTDENGWAADYFDELNASTANVASRGSWSLDNNDNAPLNQLGACEGLEEHGCKLRDYQPQEILRVENDEQSVTGADSEGVYTTIRGKDGFGSSFELQELRNNTKTSDFQNESSSEKGPKSQEESSMDGQMVGESQREIAMQLTKTDELSISHDSSTGDDNIFPNSLPAQEVNPNNKEAGAAEGVDNIQEVYASKGVSENKLADISGVGNDDHPSSSFELSLCGHQLKAGIGSVAAAEAFEAHRVSEEVYRSSAASIIKNPKLIIKYKEKYLLWKDAALLVLGMASFGLDLPIEPKDAIPVEQDEIPVSQDKDSGISSGSSGRIWRLWPVPFRKVKTSEHASGNQSSEEVFVDPEPEVQNSPSESNAFSVANQACPGKQYVRTNVPTNAQVASLNLKEGQNLVTFSFSTRVLGIQQVDAHIYLWKWNAKIVISDVDGTITKSDVLGQFMPLVGKDWTQSGVATLFSAIKENGYQLLFLSARAIVQAYLTRSFLLNLKQDGKALPNGPVVISPDGLFPSLFREVIRRAPHEFKIACLEDIRKMFPPDYNPFYAGFGNRDTDELSYRKIGIPKGKIFIINPKGEVAISHRTDRGKSYTSLHTLVNDMFPPTSLVEHEEYNAWNYWKLPLPDID